VGGGFTGCAAALEAARLRASVCVLEAETIGHGGSGRNVDLVNADHWLPPDTVLTQMGERPGRRLIQFLGKTPQRVFSIIEREMIDCGRAPCDQACNDVGGAGRLCQAEMAMAKGMDDPRGGPRMPDRRQALGQGGAEAHPLHTSLRAQGRQKAARLGQQWLRSAENPAVAKAHRARLRHRPGPRSKAG